MMLHSPPAAGETQGALQVLTQLDFVHYNHQSGLCIFQETHSLIWPLICCLFVGANEHDISVLNCSLWALHFALIPYVGLMNGLNWDYSNRTAVLSLRCFITQCLGLLHLDFHFANLPWMSLFVPAWPIWLINSVVYYICNYPSHQLCRMLL